MDDTDRIENMKTVWAMGYVPDADVDWLIAEVERLRREIKALARVVGDRTSQGAERTPLGIVAHAVRSIQGQAAELAEIHDLLAEALGYHKDAEDDPDSPCPGDYVTGEHTSVTLAMEAANKLKNSRLAEGDLGRSVDRAVDHVEELERELAARKRQCSCPYWGTIDQLMPSPDCPTHGVEAYNKKMQGELAMNELRLLRRILLGENDG
jgi:hypothetical protein